MKTTVQDLCTQSSGYYHPRDDKDVVMEIMMKNIKALKYASDRLKVILKKV